MDQEEMKALFDYAYDCLANIQDIYGDIQVNEDGEEKPVFISQLLEEFDY